MCSHVSDVYMLAYSYAIAYNAPMYIETVPQSQLPRPPSSSAKVGAKALRPSSAPWPTSPTGPNKRLIPSAACCKTSPWSPLRFVLHPQDSSSRPRRSHPDGDAQAQPGFPPCRQALPRARSSHGHDRRTFASPPARNWLPPASGTPPPWPRNCRSPMPPRTTCIRPWTGYWNGNRASRRNSPPVTWAKTVWSCTTSAVAITRATRVRWRSMVTIEMARKDCPSLSTE